MLKPPPFFFFGSFLFFNNFLYIYFFSFFFLVLFSDKELIHINTFFSGKEPRLRFSFFIDQSVFFFINFFLSFFFSFVFFIDQDFHLLFWLVLQNLWQGTRKDQHLFFGYWIFFSSKFNEVNWKQCFSYNKKTFEQLFLCYHIYIFIVFYLILFNLVVVYIWVFIGYVFKLTSK